jgi:hypothetical protein
MSRPQKEEMVMNRWITVVVAVLALSLTLGCGTSGRRARILDDTLPVGLPPVPPDLLPEVYVTDVFLGARCAEVPSGLRNCQDLLRREAARKLSQRLEEEVEAHYEDRTLREVTGGEGEGGFREDALFLSRVTSTFSGHLTLRDHESPVFALDDSDSYAMRVALVREEVDFLLWSEIAERARAEKRDAVASAFRAMRAERYGDKAPDRGRIRKVEESIAEHYTRMWNTAREQKEKLR